MNSNDVQLRERHESLYFTDGNVILLAYRPDGHELLFRVHKSVLSSHSPVFKDMFEICNTSDSKSGANYVDVYDDVPIVQMSDNADHLESVLKILYYQSVLPWMPRSPDYPLFITPILDLARKYGIDRLRNQIIGYVESDWPKTLEEWDKLEKEIRNMVNDSDGGRIHDRLPEPAATISLARQYNIPNILPAAFYHLSRISILNDWDTTHAGPSISIQNPTKRTARWGHLHAKDFRCLLLYKAKLPEFLRGCIGAEEHHHRGWRSRDGSGCQGSEALWKDICDRCSRSTDPLAFLTGSVQPTCNVICCDDCRGRLEAKFSMVRGRIWENLGDLFDLSE